jgi:hypothetical protein
MDTDEFKSNSSFIGVHPCLIGGKIFFSCLRVFAAPVRRCSPQVRLHLDFVALEAGWIAE